MDNPGLSQVGQNAITSIHGRDTETQRRRGGGGYMNMEAEIGTTWLQAQECWGVHEKLEQARNRFSPRTHTGSIALPEFGFVASRIVR
jgi:hypothetical protein